MTLCRSAITLIDYGRVFCREQEGHHGPHVAVSPYDSRHIKWRAAEDDDRQPLNADGGHP